MKHPLIINSNGKAWNGQRPRVRRSLPYQGIARRALTNTQVQKAIDEYYKEIDISAVIIKAR